MDSNFRFRARRNREILVSRWSSLILYGFARPRGSARSPHVWRSSKMPTHGRDTELVEVYGQALPTGGGRSRNRHPAVRRIHMPGDHPRFLRSQEHRHVGDVLGLDQPHQMRRRELCHPRIAR